MPERIQLSRRKGWRKPENTVVVSRPSKWGNPFKVGGEYVTNGFFGGDIGVLAIDSLQEAAGAFKAWLDGEFFVTEFHDRREWILEHVDELAGKNLACWCPTALSEDGYKQCHADALLDFAKEEAGA
jgi:hypothetical protein